MATYKNNGYKYPYLDLKPKVSIQDAAKAIGYKFDQSAGYSETTGYATFVKRAGKDVLDRIVICHPGDKSNMFYKRHNETLPPRDVIQFISENIHEFAQSAGTSCREEAIYKVMCHLANEAEKQSESNKEGQGQEEPEHQSPRVAFEPERWQRQAGDMRTAQYILSQRMLSKETGELFRNCIESVQDARNQSKWKFRNLAFPYTKAGTPYRPDAPEEIIGYEIRGREFKGRPTFKSKAAGTDSVNGCWQAYIGKGPMPAHFEEIHMAESAYDIMAYVQLHPDRNYDNALFVSVGGTFSTQLMMQLLDKYSTATPVLHFDNDLNGHIYDCRVASLMCNKIFQNKLCNKEVNIKVNGRDFSIPMDDFSYGKFREKSGLRPELRVEKPPQEYKDWNDVVKKAPLQKNLTADKVRGIYGENPSDKGVEVPPGEIKDEPEQVRRSGMRR